MDKRRTLSFVHGRGNLDHNARRKNGNPRTWGIRNRRIWNETLLERDVDEVLEKTFGAKLRKYNEEQLAGRHPERTKTMSQWVRAQRRGHPAYVEYVFQLGNKLTGCSYEYETLNGQMIDEDGSVIMPWQTRKTPKAVKRNGKIYPSREQVDLKKVYKAMYNRFTEINQYMIPVGAYIHCDEVCGVHMHVDMICVSKTKNGIGLGLGVTGCQARILKELGIKHGGARYDNAEKTWTALMRTEMTRVANEHGYEIIDGRCRGRKKVDTETYIEQENARNDYLDAVYEDLQAKKKAVAEREWAVNKRASDLEAQAAQVKRAKKEMELKEDSYVSKLKDLERRELRAQTLKNVADTEMEIARMMKQVAGSSWDEANNEVIEADKWKEKYQNVENELAGMKRRLADRDSVIEQVKVAHPEWFRDVEIGRGNGNGRKM